MTTGFWGGPADDHRVYECYWDYADAWQELLAGRSVRVKVACLDVLRSVAHQRGKALCERDCGFGVTEVRIDAPAAAASGDGEVWS